MDSNSLNFIHGQHILYIRGFLFTCPGIIWSCTLKSPWYFLSKCPQHIRKGNTWSHRKKFYNEIFNVCKLVINLSCYLEGTDNLLLSFLSLHFSGKILMIEIMEINDCAYDFFQYSYIFTPQSLLIPHHYKYHSILLHPMVRGRFPKLITHI